ncbi:MAG: hypothetical protein DRO09_00140 [Thermoprotei archaeon]|nr:MAG: hypothetical protein DRO09_00140 [Thermoprotei archaeon]
MDRFAWVKTQVREGDRVLDVGGERGVVWRMYPPEAEVVILDLNAQITPFSFVRGDAHHLPFKDRSFTVAVLAEVLEHLVNPVLAFREALRVADRVVFTVPNEYRWNPALRPFKKREHRRWFTRQLLEQLLEQAKASSYEVNPLEHDGWSFWVGVAYA